METLVRSGKTPQRVALRARIVLGAAEGRPNRALAKEPGITEIGLVIADIGGVTTRRWRILARPEAPSMIRPKGGNP